MFCDYGCGQKAIHQFGNGKWCCRSSFNKCPTNKQKNSKSSIGLPGPNKGKTWEEIQGEENSKKNKNKLIKRMKDNKFGCGYKHTKEFKLKQAKRLKGNKYTLGYKPSEATLIKLSERFQGSKNPAWRGGVSFEEYCAIFSQQTFKDMIKERDRYKCLNPCCTKKYKQIHIHHIDYDKKNCDLDNLISVCVSCNSIANFNRDWHKSWYQAILHKRYKYEY